MRKEQPKDQGVAPALQSPGHQPSASAAVPASSQSGVPNADEFAGYIAWVLAAKPDHLPYALTGISRGMDRALRAAEERAALKDQATLAVMALANGRVGKDLRETLLARVAAAIHPTGQCGYERGYIDQHAQAMSARECQDPQGLGPKAASAVGNADAPESPHS